MRKTIAIAGAVAMSALGGTAQAAPSGLAVRPATAGIEQVAYRRCWYDNGVRYCRRYYDADDYVYDDGYWGGPVFGFSFGSGRGHFRGGHIGGHTGGHGGHGGHGGRR